MTPRFFLKKTGFCPFGVISDYLFVCVIPIDFIAFYPFRLAKQIVIMRKLNPDGYAKQYN